MSKWIKITEIIITVVTFVMNLFKKEKEEENEVPKD